MGSIPLPALHLNPPPPQPNVMEQYSQLMQLKNQMANAPLQRQILQQTAQQGQLDIREKQQAMKDQQAMSAAMAEWGKPKTPSVTTNTGAVIDPQTGQPITSGSPVTVTGPAGAGAPTSSASLPNYDDLIELARKNGASFNAIKGLQTSILDMRTKAATIAKDDADTGQKNVETMKAKNGMIVSAMNGVMSLPDEQLPQAIMQTAQQLAQQGLLDPQHVQMAQQIAQLGDPAQMRQRIDLYNKTLGGYSQILTDAQKKAELVKTQGASDPNSPFYAPSPTAVTLGTAPKAAEIQAGEVRQKARVAGAEASARQPFQMALQRQEQALRQGDPQAAAQLLVDGDATLSELKSRGATPDFIARTLFAARQLSGGKYNAQEADANYSVAKSPANVAFFGSARSLTDKGGTLDQLAETAKSIPQNQFPVFNSLEDWTKEATGNGPLAKYAAQVLGVADDYSKVMGGGQGSDSSRLQAANLISKKLSAEGRDGAISGVRGSVLSQINGRIGNNPVLKRMYGDAAPQTAPTPQTHTFSIGAWQRANPRGDAAAAKAAAEAQHYQVVP